MTQEQNCDIAKLSAGLRHKFVTLWVRLLKQLDVWEPVFVYVNKLAVKLER